MRTLGKSGITVSELGLGTVKFGRNKGVRYPTGFELPTDRDIAELMGFAWSGGINLVDTAPAYGTCEKRLGEYLATDANDWVVCTKTGESWTDGQSRFDFSAAATEASVTASLRLLGRVDIVLVHSDGNDEEILQRTPVMETLSRFRDRGDIRAIGMSTKTVAGGLLAVDCCDVVMVTLNEMDKSQMPVIHAASQANVGVMVKKALASGHSQSPDAALKFVLGNKGVTTAIVGTLSPQHLEANINALI